MAKPSNARSEAARKGWRTRRINQRARSEAAKRRARTRAYNRELEAIEDLLDEDFETLEEARRALEEETEEPEDQVHEWLATFAYKRSGRTLDAIATAYDEDEALEVTLVFLRKKKYGHVADAIERGDKGWEVQISKGRATRRKAGHAEFRSES